MFRPRECVLPTPSRGLLEECHDQSCPLWPADYSLPIWRIHLLSGTSWPQGYSIAVSSARHLLWNRCHSILSESVPNWFHRFPDCDQSFIHEFFERNTISQYGSFINQENDETNLGHFRSKC